MFQDKMVLCASSAYEKKFYLNENFEGLPQHVKDELKIMCVLFTEDVGGVLSLEFDENGNLELNTSADEGDLLYDEIGSVLKIKQMQQEKQHILPVIRLQFLLCLDIWPDSQVEIYIQKMESLALRKVLL